MYIQIVYSGRLPVLKYGGTERVIWYLGKELAKMGHKVSYLAARGSYCNFGNVTEIDPDIPIENQTDPHADILHFQSELSAQVSRPHIITIHGNISHNKNLSPNSVFVSRDHALRHNSTSYVYNGLDWDDYGTDISTDRPRLYYHFLGKAAWRVKNVKGAISIIKKLPNEKLYVLGGTRLNFKMGFRFSLTPKARFFGMVGGEEKNNLLRGSKGLIFPVRWSEPFGLAITESLYSGCPVFGTPYGSLSEIVNSDVGFLADSESELALHIKESSYNTRRCHEYARDMFNSRIMAEAYIKCYEKVLNGETLNPEPPRTLNIIRGRLPWHK